VEKVIRSGKGIGKKTFVAFVILISLTFSFYLSGHLDTSEVPASDGYNESVQQLFDRVVEKVEEIRGYNPMVEVKVVTKDWVLEKWGSSAINEENLKDEEVFYKSLLLVPSNFSFGARKNKEVGGFMAFYWENKVYVVKENFDPEWEGAGEALAHELEHAIQELYFNLKHDPSFDGDKAYGAVVEGDAVLTGWLYAGKNVEEEVREINESINCFSEPNKGYAGESNLNHLYFFPYTFGTEYIVRAYLDGGYAAVDGILKDPPVTTSEILHPGRKSYRPVRLEESDLNFFKADLKAFRVVKDTRMGEFFLYLFLSSHLNDCEALRAADGWSGDHLRVLRNGDDFVYYWKVSFYGENDAEEFLSAFRAVLEKIGRRVGNYWITGGEYVREEIVFVRDGREILIAARGRL